MAKFHTTALGVRYDIYGPDNKLLADGVLGMDFGEREWPEGSCAYYHRIVDPESDEDFDEDPHYAT